MKKTRLIYNLEFPSWCPEINIFNYKFSRSKDYPEKVLALQHLANIQSEYNKEITTGIHSRTAYVELPPKGRKSYSSMGWKEQYCADGYFVVTFSVHWA